MATTTLLNDIAFTQLSMKTKQAILGQCLFLSFALVIPSITLSLGFHYLYAQPLHWMILFAGLTYDSFSGIILGTATPVVSYLITGIPVSMNLPLIIPELALYSFVAGLLKRKISAFGSLIINLAAGRIVYLILFAFTGRLDNYSSVFQFIQMIWEPSLGAVILQIIFLPLLSGLYIHWIKD